MKVTVNEAQSNEVDWSKNPQLVVDESGGIVFVLKSDDSRFTGVVVKHANGFPDNTGEFSELFTKKHFKPFHGSITLSND